MPYHVWLSEDTQVFSSNPERGSPSGTIPPSTQVLFLFYHWPTQRREDIYVGGNVEKIAMLFTPTKFQPAAGEVSVRGFTIYKGSPLFVHRETIYQSVKDK